MPHFLTPITEKGKQWVKDNVVYEDWQLTGESIAVDSRILDNIVEGMVEGGLVEEQDFKRGF